MRGRRMAGEYQLPTYTLRCACAGPTKSFRPPAGYPVRPHGPFFVTRWFFDRLAIVVAVMSFAAHDLSASWAAHLPLQLSHERSATH